jgi:putative hydrolase of the HAD superfamily
MIHLKEIFILSAKSSMAIKHMIFFDLDNTLIDHNKSESIAILNLCKIFQIQDTPNEITQTWREISKKYYNQYLFKNISFEEQRVSRISEFFSKYNAIDPNINEPLVVSHLTTSEIGKIFDLYLQHYESNWCIFDVCIPALLDHRFR